MDARVKPLEWAHKVRGPRGDLEVRAQDDGRVEFFTWCGLYTIRDRGTQEAPMYVLRRLAAHILASAKLSDLYDAAQADHAARILAALEPAPDLAELVGAADRVRAASAIEHARASQFAAEAKVARLKGALTEIDALDPEKGYIGACSENAIRGLVLRMGEIARAALTEIPADGAADE